MKQKKIGMRIFAGVFAALLSALGVAWACTPSSSIVLLPETGPAGSKITVAGQVAPQSGSMPVEIRWNSVSGLLLGTATADATRDFTVQITVPDAPAGIYYVMAIAGDAEAGRAVFEVTESPAAVSAQQAAGPRRSVSADIWSGLAKPDSAPSPADAADSGRGAASKSGLAAGIALVAVGMAALATPLLVSNRARSRGTRHSV